MKKLSIRCLCMMLMLALLLSAIPFWAFAAQRNTGTRHELCKELSSQAQAYYTGNYSPDALVSYETDTTGSCLKAVDSELYNALQTLMTKTMTKSVSYNSLTGYWPDTDCSNGSSNAVLFYSDKVSGDYNREHVWPKSRASFLKQNGGCDLHHLRPTNSGVNSARSNFTFANVREFLTNPETYSYGGRTVLWLDKTYSEGSPEEQNTTDKLGMVEVNDNIKGDTARVLLYVYTRWEERNLFENEPNPRKDSSDDENNGLRVMYDLDTLLQWCEIDPVDTWEMSRNDATQAVQGNRNVFIDYPELAWIMFGQTPPADMAVPEKLPLNLTNYTVTASSNNEAWGTVAVNGKRITATPKEGYYAKDYTVLSGTATVSRQGNVFTVKPESDCSVQINFAAKEAVTATFNGTAAPITAYAEDMITLPSASDVDTYSFVGWVTERIEMTSIKPAYYEAGSKYTLSANTAFYALYAYSDGVVFGEWVRINDTSALMEGSQLVIASPENGVVAAPLNGKYLTDAPAKFAQDGSAIEELPENAVILTLGGKEGAWTLADEEGKLLGAVAAKNVGWNAGTMEWKISFSGNSANLFSTNESYGRILYNQQSPRFTMYTNNPESSTIFAIPQLYTNGGGKIYYTTELVRCGHEACEYYEAVEATCTEDGNLAYYFCWDCGKYFADEDLSQVITLEETVIAALGHDYIPEPTSTTPSCTEATIITYGCTRCHDTYQEEIPAPGHAWDEGVVTVNPTETQVGILTYTCIRCGETKTEEIPMITCPNGDACGSHTFTDMPAIGDWAHAGIDFVVKEGLFNGMSKTIFAPNKAMTRAMLVTVLWRQAGEPKAEPADFTDVDQSEWYGMAVNWAAEKGVVNGMGNGTFRPDNQLTREQLATILFRYVKLTEMDPPERTSLEKFPDAGDVQPYAEEALQWAVARGLINGVKNNATGETNLLPGGSATRAQVATILMRFLNN